jgi:hypothetical protein
MERRTNSPDQAMARTPAGHYRLALTCRPRSRSANSGQFRTNGVATAFLVAYAVSGAHIAD